MKPKRKPGISLARVQSQARSGQSDEGRRRVWLWLVAVLLAIVFLAGECAYLLPVE